MKKGLGPSVRATQDRATYFVLDEFEGKRIFRETGEEEADRKTVIQQIIGGQYAKPLRVIAFNTAEDWARDVTRDIAREIVEMTEPLSESARAFVSRVSDLLPLGFKPGSTPASYRAETSAVLFKWF
jgi:hypothetical protein